MDLMDWTDGRAYGLLEEALCGNWLLASTFLTIQAYSRRMCWPLERSPALLANRQIDRRPSCSVSVYESAVNKEGSFNMY